MPIVSEKALQELYANDQRCRAMVDETAEKYEKEIRKRNILGGATCLTSALAIGAARGYTEKNGKSFQLGDTTVDIEALVGIAAVAAGATGKLGEYGFLVSSAGMGVLSHYAGQVGRKLGHTGELNLIAGNVSDDSYDALPVAGVGELPSSSAAANAELAQVLDMVQEEAV